MAVAEQASEAGALTRISFEEVRKHCIPGDCWVIVEGHVYDVSDIDHPNASEVISKYAGDDATAAFNEIQAPGLLQALRPHQLIGLVDSTTIPRQQKTREVKQANRNGNLPQPSTVTSKPPLHSLISVHDFEEVARRTFNVKTMAFYGSAATDLVSFRANSEFHKRLLLRPRVLRNVRDSTTKISILGCDSSAPFFFSPAAMARLAHPDGELAVARACGNQNICQVISTNASYPLEDIIAAGRPGQPFFLQLYVNSDRQQTADLLAKAKRLGMRGVFLTVDAPVPGKREADERIPAAGADVRPSGISGAVATSDAKGGGLGRVMGRYIDPAVVWEDLAWIKQVSGGLPVVLKGVQTAADARKAVEYGAEGILLSNHGGRSLDTAQPAMLTLLELHKASPEVFDQLEVYVDGGFTRGTDILKAIALGAVAVGIGRPWLYAVNYGQEGVEHMCEILKDELTTSMKLCGITDVDEAHPGMVNTAALEPLVRSSESHPWIRWSPKARL